MCRAPRRVLQGVVATQLTSFWPIASGDRAGETSRRPSPLPSAEDDEAPQPPEVPSMFRRDTGVSLRLPAELARVVDALRNVPEVPLSMWRS